MHSTVDEVHGRAAKRSRSLCGELCSTASDSRCLENFFVPYSEGDFVTTVFLWQVEAVCIATDNIACAGLEVGTWWVVFCPGSKRGNVGGTGAVAEVRRRNLPVEFFLMQISCGLKHPVGRGEQVSKCSLTAIKPVLTSN